MRYFCSPQHTDSVLYPVISQLERAARLAHDDTAQAKLDNDKLDTLLAQSSTPTEDVVLFAEMLSLPNDGRYPKLELAPQQRRQHTLEALRSQIEGLAERDPVLMVFEDVHWADPTSLELFELIVERASSFPLLAIVTFRPEFVPPWVSRPQVTLISLNRLPRRLSAEMMLDSGESLGALWIARYPGQREGA